METVDPVCSMIGRAQATKIVEHGGKCGNGGPGRADAQSVTTARMDAEEISCAEIVYQKSGPGAGDEYQ